MSFIKWIMLIILITLSFNLIAKCNDFNISNVEELDKKIEEIKRKDLNRSKNLNKDELIFESKNIRRSLYSNLFNECIRNNIAGYDLTKLTNKQLKDLFKRINTIQFYTSNKDEVLLLIKIIDEISKNTKKNKLRPFYWELNEALTRARMFQEIQSYKEIFDSLDIDYVDINSFKDNDITILADSDARLFIDYKESKKEFSIKDLVLNNKSLIVVVSHPFCHFSQDARDFIANSELLKKTFEENALWLIPPNGKLDISSVTQDPHSKDFPFKFVYDQDQWPEIDYWGTPTFYFYKDGELKYKVVGWADGREVYIRQGLEKIGLL